MQFFPHASDAPSYLTTSAVPIAILPSTGKRAFLQTPLLLCCFCINDITSFASPQTFGDDIFGGGPFPDYVHPPPSDEYQSHILQVNVPLACLEPNQSNAPKLSKLPVLVYIHGGGFTLGKIDQQHNTALMVEQSLFDSQPLISASIQYRLGALGFIHTLEPGHSNLGLHDQRNALLWIQKFIAGFGGDEERVTVFGESAGSMSICCHMCSSPPPSGRLFRRAILMSGVVSTTTTPTPVGEANKLYEKLLEKLNIGERGEEALGKLRKLDVQEIVDASAKLTGEGEMWLPTQDGEWFGKDTIVTWDNVIELIGKCDWVDEIVLGTTGFEGTTFMPVIATLTPTTFLDAITSQLGPQSASEIAAAYSITLSMDQNLFITAVTRWIGDIIFDAPVHALSQYLTTHTTKKVYRYIFDVRNPFPGHNLYQIAHHWVDVYFVFKTFRFRYPTQRLKDVSTRFAQLWVDFANGKAPWAEYKYTGNGEDIIMVADERDGWTERTVAEDEKLTELNWKRCEQLWEAWKDQRGKWFLPLKIEPLKNKKMV